jgi:septal ring factor EnvC (AmiA/AmiB activator)
MKTELQLLYYFLASLGWALAFILGHLSWSQGKQIKKFKKELQDIRDREAGLEQMIKNSKEACKFLAGIISDEKIHLDTAAKINEIFMQTLKAPKNDRPQTP